MPADRTPAPGNVYGLPPLSDGDVARWSIDLDDMFRASTEGRLLSTLDQSAIIVLAQRLLAERAEALSAEEQAALLRLALADLAVEKARAAYRDLIESGGHLGPDVTAWNAALTKQERAEEERQNALAALPESIRRRAQGDGLDSRHMSEEGRA